MIQTDILIDRSKGKITECLSGGDGIANRHATSKGRYVRHAMWRNGSALGANPEDLVRILVLQAVSIRR